MHYEEEVLGFWARKNIFEKSVKKRGASSRRFVFYEGPPTANGKPGLHHVEARAFKDVIVRYKTMRGFRVERRAGWDTHGLPIEIAVEKKLGIEHKQDIEDKVGIEQFIEEARKEVFGNKSEWEKMTERMGYWLDFKDAYITMDNSYIETLWWIIKQFHIKKYLYEDDKITPWCTRCGTALSSHELAQGYKKVTDQSVYVRFHLKTRRASLLVWTTTPWTLPANVAAVVDPEGDYVTIENKGEKFILLASRAEKLFPDIAPLWHEKGEKLLGLEYDPPYPHEDNPYRIVAGDFVSADDGTGVVHIAPAFGEDDMRIGKKESLPVFMTIDEEGHFTDVVPQWKGMFVKKADSHIIKDLDQKGLLWKQEAYEHEYPFCWRCDSPLLYIARRSWWVRVSKVRRELVEANKKINWYPSYFKEGRFGQWVNEAKDWAFSRQRYWGTPLPVWKCDSCTSVDVLGSVEELISRSIPSTNSYYLMRHGYAKSNALDIGVSDPKGDTYGLTPRGKAEIKKSVALLKKQKIDLIVSSDLLRTQETAKILSKELGVPMILDEDMREIQFGPAQERKESRAITKKWTNKERLEHALPGGENYTQLKERMQRLYMRLENMHKGKNIVLVGHGDPWWFFEAIAKGSFSKDGLPTQSYPKTGSFKKITPVGMPRNKRGELDLHRPYLDEVKIKCLLCDGSMQRVTDVVDVWFDSGSMPYAAWHYPFENKERIDKKISFPADYIAEAVDQTRGWFYMLLTVAVLLGKGIPFKNVLSLGHVLDKTGKKMSKSRGNVVEPMELFDEYGADAVRWYFFTVNQPEDAKLFDVGDIARAKRNFLDLLTNTARFLDIYSKGVKKVSKNKKHIMDRWVIAKLAFVRNEVTRRMDAYDIVGAARILEQFVAEDISRWYVRRSRDRMRGGEGLFVLQNVLLEVAILAAPFVPFTSENIYKSMKGRIESVHLALWPEKKTQSKKLLSDMEEIRHIAARGHELRSRAAVKVRQPLASLSVKKMTTKDSELLAVLEEELNVKKIIIDKNLTEDSVLDTAITPELREEGETRELVRSIQDLRKKHTLEPKDKIALYYKTTDDQDLGQKREVEIKKGARVVRCVRVSEGETVTHVGTVHIIDIKKE